MSSPYYSFSDTPPGWAAPSTDSDIPVPVDKSLLPVCNITGLIGLAVPDLPADEDQVPEIETLNGFGDVIPGADFLLAPHFVDSAISIRLRPLQFNVVNGRIMHNGTAGFSILAGDEYTQPQQVPYTIKLSVFDKDGTPVKLPEITFNATQGTVDYTMLTPVPGDPDNTIRGPVGFPGPPGPTGPEGPAWDDPGTTLNLVVLFENAII